MKRIAKAYQVRMPAEAGPDGFLDGLTWAVWRTVAQTRGSGCLDQHRWPELRSLLQQALAGRLVRYGECGERKECRAAPEKVFWAGENRGRLPAGKIHILEILGGVDRLLDEIGAVVERHFRDDLRISLRERRNWRLDLSRALKAAVSERLCYSPACQDCAARKGFRERRLWHGPKRRKP